MNRFPLNETPEDWERSAVTATRCEGVQRGICVVMFEEEIIFAGEIKDAPIKLDGALVLLNSADFEMLRTAVEKHRN